MNTSRDQILHDVRSHLPIAEPLPSLDYAWTRYDDPIRQFLDVLKGVGGSGQVVQDGAAEAHQQLVERARQLDAQNICSALPHLFQGNVNVAADDAHDLADVDLAILPGELAVAENAAVWVTGSIVPQRVAYFLSQHVVLVIPAQRVVNNMHEAYQWLSGEPKPGGPFDRPKWGTFMSGPSKTADIEQALVIGAHGARSLHVLLMAE